MSAKLFGAAAAILAFQVVAACSNNPSDPEISMASVAGDYVAGGSHGALDVTTIANGESTDWLAAGASVELALDVDGTTTGQIMIPGAGEGGLDFTADLAGHWTLDGEIVRFQHAADTFIRDMDFEVVGSTLVGDRSFADVRVRMDLRKE